jgi:hypothetical protein
MTMIDYTILNLVTFLVGLIFLLNGYQIVRKGREAIVLFVMSALIGFSLVIVAIYPSAFTVLIASLGVDVPGRGLLVLSNLSLFVLVMYLFHRIGDQYESISRLNEELSLLKARLDEDEE